jgi:mono/diheme cytochrome c family protein
VSVAEQGAAKAWVLAFVLMAGVGLGGFIGIGCLVGANTCPGKSRAKITSTNGKEIFVLANCAGCHGSDARGGRGPSLVSGPLGELTVDELVPKIKKGKPLGGMPRFRDELNETQIRAVAEYVVSLRDAA